MKNNIKPYMIRLLLICVFTIFVAEAITMFLLNKFIPEASVGVKALGDALLFSIIVIPSLYLFIYRYYNPLAEEESHDERWRAQDALKKAREQLRMAATERIKSEERVRLATKVFEITNEAIAITDGGGNIIYVNEAFENMSGFSKDEAIGKNPRILKSGRHDKKFYEKMWKSIIDTGYWQGEIWDRKKNGEIYPKWMSISAVKDDTGAVTHYVGVSADMSKMKQTEERLQYLAHFDQLTGLPNRLLLNDRLEQAISLSKRHKHTMVLAILDLDEFKKVNDSLGHLTGDRLLKVVSERLTSCIRKSDTVARLGGDEFAVLLHNTKRPEDAAHLAQKIIDTLAEPFTFEGNEVFITASIGITLCPDDSDNMNTLMKNADTAMYHAKSKGKNNFQFFTEEMNTSIMEQLLLETRLRHALKNEEFYLHYQPRVDSVSRKVKGVEALVRWSHPSYGTVPPSKFIPITEQTGLIVQLGEWVLQEACRTSMKWQQHGMEPLIVSVNLSAVQFREIGLKDMVERTLAETGLSPEYLELEITESIIMHDVLKAIEIMHGLKDMGIKLTIDDFGTGYSSLSYLKRFPISTLKIDRSFVMDISNDPDDRAVVKAVIALAHSLKLEVVAEGVETKEQLEFLEQNGCDEIQGYYFSKPIPDKAFELLMKEGQWPKVVAGIIN